MELSKDLGMSSQASQAENSYDLLDVVSQEISPPSTDQIIDIFDGLFTDSEQTKLIGGGQEPLYRPADGHQTYHHIIFTRDYLSSALHEVAHWCIAGPKRRKMLDYGYWYAPDGRTAEQQSQFAQVEVKPQALEWILSEACRHQFHISQDNLNGDICAHQQHLFKQNVVQQVDNYLENGLPQRAHILNQALLDYYQSRERFGRHLFTLARL